MLVIASSYVLYILESKAQVDRQPRWTMTSLHFPVVYRDDGRGYTVATGLDDTLYVHMYMCNLYTSFTVFAP